MTEPPRRPGPGSGRARGRRPRGRRGDHAPSPAVAPPPRPGPVAEAPSELPATLTPYLAPPGLEAELRHELEAAGVSIVHAHGRLLLTDAPPIPSAWAQDVWTDARWTAIRSISDAAATLRAIQRNWVPWSEVDHRRVALITERLPPIRARAWPFPCELPRAPLGAFTLLDRERMLYSPTRRSPFPHGQVDFEEDREGPPSRAYLKLWETFTLLDERPAAGARCIDVGAAPGGWTWALAQLGAEVLAVDKAPLDPKVAALPRVTSRRESAFGLDPREHAERPFDWFFSDVICYPERLLRMVRAWMEAGAAKRFVCTLKFHGATDHATVEAFAAIPGSRLVHLSHNGHELTWIR